MPEILVSILIPCYNAEQWIAQTLESALAQTWNNKEIIVVDDGSKDNSFAVAKQFESSSLKVIRQENSGASAARNRALHEAQGDFIQYLDADDLLAPNKIELQLQYLLNEENSGYIASAEWARFYNSSQEATFVPEAVWSDLSPIDWLICSWEGGGMMHPAAWLIPRGVVEEAGFWSASLPRCPNDDGEYFCRVILASKGVKFCPGAKCYYRSGISGSLSGLNSRAATESIFHSLELCTNHLLSKEDSPRTRHACATAFQRFVYDVYPHQLDLAKQAEAKVHLFGGSNLKPVGGPVFKLIANTLGWKLARQIQKIKARTA
jgi:glycosyltransferase involved in cell wall biosynthesis